MFMFKAIDWQLLFFVGGSLLNEYHPIRKPKLNHKR